MRGLNRQFTTDLPQARVSRCNKGTWFGLTIPGGRGLCYSPKPQNRPRTYKLIANLVAQQAKPCSGLPYRLAKDVTSRLCARPREDNSCAVSEKPKHEFPNSSLASAGIVTESARRFRNQLDLTQECVGVES